MRFKTDEIEIVDLSENLKCIKCKKYIRGKIFRILEYNSRIIDGKIIEKKLQKAINFHLKCAKEIRKDIVTCNRELTKSIKKNLSFVEKYLFDEKKKKISKMNFISK